MLGAAFLLLPTVPTFARSIVEKIMAKRPDPKSVAALAGATSEKGWIVPADSQNALSRRGEPSVLPQVEPKLDDEKVAVRITAATTIIHLQDVAAGKPDRKKQWNCIPCDCHLLIESCCGLLPGRVDDMDGKL